jgi:rubrerythrin
MEKAAKHIATVWGYRKVSPADENAFLQIIQGEYVAAQTKEDVNAKSNESKGLDGAGHQLSASSTSAYVEQLRFERDLLQKEVDRLSAQTTPAKCRICGHAEDHTIHVDENHPSCHKFIAAGSAHTGGGTDKEK